MPDKLTVQQKLFCMLYTSDPACIGNGVRSYIKAYNIDIKKPGAYNVAKSGASENLTKPYILAEINRLLEVSGLSDDVVDKQLSFLITQHANLPVKLAAIREYNKILRRSKEEPTQVSLSDLKTLKRSELEKMSIDQLLGLSENEV